MMKAYQLHRHFLCIDLKSFYASVECVLLGLDPFSTPLVVADVSRGSGSIVLAVSPYLKAKGMPGRCRIHELPTDLGIIFQKPRMRTYLEFATRVIGLYLRFVSEEDLHIYSIDEVFLDVTSYLHYYEMNAVELAGVILKTLREDIGLYATCGVGPNMLLAKLALDLESKQSPDFIACWDYADVPAKLWPVTPLSKMWGIGHHMERHLNALGLSTIGDIAHYDCRVLKKRFGIMGEELYYHTHGIDMSLLQQKATFKPRGKSYGIGQTLFHDYHVPDIFQVMLEMTDDLAKRLRRAGKTTRTIALGIGYSKAVGGGFGRQVTLDQGTCHGSVIFKACLDLFRQHDDGSPIRRIHISTSQLADAGPYQFSLFEDAAQLVKEQRLYDTIDQLHDAYGNNSVTRASSELEASTVKARNRMIGGHHV